MRIQRILLVSAVCVSIGSWSGCANRNACGPYQQQIPQYPQQIPQYPQQFQAYPYTGQPGASIQPSPSIGIPPGAALPPQGYGPPQGFIQGQPQAFQGLPPSQPNPYYVPQTGQANQPYFGR